MYIPLKEMDSLIPHKLLRLTQKQDIENDIPFELPGSSAVNILSTKNHGIFIYLDFLLFNLTSEQSSADSCIFQRVIARGEIVRVQIQISWPNRRHKRSHWFWLIHPLGGLEQ